MSFRHFKFVIAAIRRGNAAKCYQTWLGLQRAANGGIGGERGDVDTLQLLNAQIEISKAISCHFNCTYNHLIMSQIFVYLKISSIRSCLCGDDDILNCENKFYISISIVSSID